MGVAGAKYDYGEIVDYSKIVHGLKKKMRLQIMILEDLCKWIH